MWQCCGISGLSVEKKKICICLQQICQFRTEIRRITSRLVARKFPHIKRAMRYHSQWLLFSSLPFVFHQFAGVWLWRNNPKDLKARHYSTTREQIITKGDNVSGPGCLHFGGQFTVQHYANRVSENLLSIFCNPSAARVNHELGIIRSTCSVLADHHRCRTTVSIFHTFSALNSAYYYLKILLQRHHKPFIQPDWSVLGWLWS